MLYVSGQFQQEEAVFVKSLLFCRKNIENSLNKRKSRILMDMAFTVMFP